MRLWGNNTEINVTEIGFRDVDWINLAKDL